MLFIANDLLKEDLKENNEHIHLDNQKDLGLLLERRKTWPTTWPSK